ncbi:MAG: TspO/MBR family protein [Acidobacteriota bacterium]
MANEMSGTDRLRSILAAAATLGVLAINWLAASGRVNDVTPAEISAKYSSILTPAGYAFSIWTLIYAGLIAFSVLQLLPRFNERMRSIRSAYITTCALNCAWIYFWHSEQIAVCAVLIVALALVLFVICRQLRDVSDRAEYWLAKAPFGLYFGWITTAAIVNVSLLPAYFGTNIPETTTSVIGAVLILAAAALGVLVRMRLINYVYPLAIAWALTAIAVRQSGHTLVVAAAAVGVIACLIAALSFVINLPSSGDLAA